MTTDNQEALRVALEALEHARDRVHDAGFSATKQEEALEIVRAALQSAPAQEQQSEIRRIGAGIDMKQETEAWLIEYSDDRGEHKAVYRHNAIGDFRLIDPSARCFDLIKRTLAKKEQSNGL